MLVHVTTEPTLMVITPGLNLNVWIATESVATAGPLGAEGVDGMFMVVAELECAAAGRAVALVPVPHAARARPEAPITDAVRANERRRGDVSRRGDVNSGAPFLGSRGYGCFLPLGTDRVTPGGPCNPGGYL